MNLFNACEQFKKELKENFNLDVEIIPTQCDTEIGFTMSKLAVSENDEELTVQFLFNPTEK